MPKLELKEISVAYIHKKGDTTTAIDHLNLTVEDGCFLVVLGPSGCGKTTLLRSIAGMNNFDGFIYCDGKDIEDSKVKDRNIAYVSQTFDLYPHLTIYDNLAFPLKERKIKPEEIDRRVVEIARKMELLPCLTRKPKQISIGQQQRVTLAKSLIKKPTTMLFDEPLSNIDPVLRDFLLKDIKKVAKEFNATSIYVTHDVKETLLVADKVAVMEKGKIVFIGRPEEMANSKVKLVQELLIGGGIK